MPGFSVSDLLRRREDPAAGAAQGQEAPAPEAEASRDEAIRQALDVLSRAAAGDLEARITGITAPGDLGELLWKINEVLDRSDAFVRESRAAMEYVSSHRYYRRVMETGMLGSYGEAARTINEATASMAGRVQAFQEVAAGFERSCEGIVEDVVGAARQLEATAQALGHGAQSTRDRAVSAASGAEEGATTVNSVAASVEQVTASIGEISRQVHHSADRLNTAVHNTDSARSTADGLSELAAKIGDVVGLIDEIAGKTNLLSLNATIEAARAGEAGKGFAVVASEVKGLAQRTIGATEVIRKNVEGMQSETGSTVDAVGQIADSVARLQEAFNAIAAAVEEQDAAMNEISRNVTELAGAVSGVARDVGDISAAADETRDASTEVMGAATQLSRQGVQLRESVSGFLAEVRRVV